MKTVLRLSIVLVLGLLLVVGSLFFFRNGMIETSVEQAGQFAFGVPTPLDGVVTELGSGRFALEGFAVTNPEGFSEKPVFKLGTASMTLPVTKLFSLGKEDPIVIPELRIAGLGVSIERNDKGFNFTPIMDRVQGLSKAAGGGGTEPAPTEPPPAGPSRPIVIERIVFEDWTLDASFGSGLALPTQRLSALVLTDVRAGPEGLPGIMGQITEKLLAYASEKIGIEGLSPELLAQLDALKARLAQDIPNLDELKAELEGKAQEQIDALKGEAQERLDALKDQAQGQVDALLGDITGQGAVIEGEAKEQLEALQGELGGALEGLGADAQAQFEELMGSVTGEGAPIEGATEQLETLLEQVKESAELPPETQAKVEEVLESLGQGAGGGAGEIQKKAEELQKGLGGLLGGKPKKP